MSNRGHDLAAMGRATAALLLEKGSIAPVDVFLKLGYLSPLDYERWRRRQVPALERVIRVNLSRITFLMQALRRQSLAGQLQPRTTVSTSWGRGRRVLLCFSLSGDPQIEAAYSTHDVAGREGEAIRHARLEKRQRLKIEQVEDET
jgi:hypothetical protein